MSLVATAACGNVPVGPNAASAPASKADGVGETKTGAKTPSDGNGEGRPSRELGDASAAGRRIVAIGDVHGDLAAAKSALRLAGLIDAAGQWTGGDTVLVQTGDQLDRGDDEKEILELLGRLESQASEAGGAVHVLNGNHELMNAAGDFRYVTEGGFADFADVDASALAAVPAAAQIPDEARGRVAAFMPGGPWAKKLAERDVVLVLDGTVFVHGGITPAWAARGVEAINESVQKWLREGGAPPAAVTDDEGPVWTRAYSDAPDAGDCAALDESLAALGAERMVVGHTVHREGIVSACDGKVWMIDVGMAAHYGGRPAALELRGDEVRVLGGE